MSDNGGLTTPWIVVIILCVVVTGLLGYVCHTCMARRTEHSRRSHGGGEYYEITGLPSSSRRMASTGYSPALPAPALAPRSRGY